MSHNIELIDRLIQHYSPGQPGEKAVLIRGWGDTACAGAALRDWGEEITMSPEGIAKCLGIDAAQAARLFYTPASRVQGEPALQTAREILAEIRETVVAPPAG